MVTISLTVVAVKISNLDAVQPLFSVYSPLELPKTDSRETGCQIIVSLWSLSGVSGSDATDEPAK